MDNNVLAQLKDIHLPAPVGVLPLAPGWWVIIITFTLIVLYSGFYTLRYYWRRRAVKRALKMLERFKLIYKKEGDVVVIAGHLSALLRRVAIAYYPRNFVAGLKGQDWVDFLDRNSKKANFNQHRELLIKIPYQYKSNVSLTPLFSQCELWINERGRKCLS
jgi:Domain of unknown function (DUF4381)